MGFVYLFGSEHFGWYKIGKAKVADVRLEQLGILLPFKVDVFAIWEAECHTTLEKQIHRLHQDFHINGEWFSFSVLEREDAIRRISGWAKSIVFPTGMLKSKPIRSCNVAKNKVKGLGGDNRSLKHLEKRLGFAKVMEELGFSKENKDEVRQAWDIFIARRREEKLALTQV